MPYKRARSSTTKISDACSEEQRKKTILAWNCCYMDMSDNVILTHEACIVYEVQFLHASSVTMVVSLKSR